MPDGERIRPPRWLRPVNKVLIVMLRLGCRYPRRSPVVLTVPGRKTGKPRSTPVTPMDVDGKRYVVNGYPGADWVDNVRAAGEVTLAHGRRSERVRWSSSRRRMRDRCCGRSSGRAHRRRLDEAGGPAHRGHPRRGRGVGGPLPRVPRRPLSRSVEYGRQQANQAAVVAEVRQQGDDRGAATGFGFGGKGPMILVVPGRRRASAADADHSDDRRRQALRAGRAAGQ